MDLIGKVLGYLLSFSYSHIQNYGLLLQNLKHANHIELSRDTLFCSQVKTSPNVRDIHGLLWNYRLDVLWSVSDPEWYGQI